MSGIPALLRIVFIRSSCSLLYSIFSLVSSVIARLSLTMSNSEKPTMLIINQNWNPATKPSECVAVEMSEIMIE